MSESRARLGAPFYWFLASGTSWFGAWGMQHVIFSWLLVGELQADPAWVGTAQMLQTLPALLFMLLAGSVADRFGRRRMLALIHLVGALAPLLLAWIVASDRLTLTVILLYAPVWGCLQSFQYPAREALLFDAGRNDVPRAVAGSTLAQFVFQGIGNLLAGLPAFVGTVPVLGLQGLLSLLGIEPLRHLPASRPSAAAIRAGGVRETARSIAEGLRIVRQSRQLRVLAGLVAANGFFFLGPYFVLCPVLIRDFYGGASGDIALGFSMFPLGTVLVSGALFLRGTGRAQGALLLCGLLLGSLCLLAIALQPSFGVYLAVIFVWGLGGGFFITMSRTLFLAAAPAEFRGRILSVQGLALLGMAPLSNLVSGLLAEAIGVHATFFWAGVTMATILVAAYFMTGVARYRSDSLVSG